MNVNMNESESLENLLPELRNSGHQVDTCSYGHHVRPKPDSSIVVGVQPDVTLYPAYRRRFFVCQAGAEAILTRTDCPTPITRRWRGLLDRVEPRESRALLAGPGTWTLTRLIKHTSVLIWGVGSPYWYQSDCDREYELIERVLGITVDSGPWRKHLLEGTHQEAHYINPLDDQFADILAAYFLLSSYNSFDFCVTNTHFSEVYVIHHHDKVTASLPVPDLLEQTLRSLTGNPDLYLDVSDYRCVCDGEWEEGA